MSKPNTLKDLCWQIMQPTPYIHKFFVILLHSSSNFSIKSAIAHLTLGT